MEIFDWLYSIEDKVVFILGSISLKDLRMAIQGFQEAQRFYSMSSNDLFFSGFQQYVEGVYGDLKTSKGWEILITEHSSNAGEALNTFYLLLRKYHLSLLKNQPFVISRRR